MNHPSNLFAIDASFEEPQFDHHHALFTEKRQLIDDGDASATNTKSKSAARKIEIKYINDRNRRHITFSKRKMGIMKKAYELSTLTGTQVLLLIASETGHVYTFATPKLQSLITSVEGKQRIQNCLNAPDSPEPSNNKPVPDSTEVSQEDFDQNQIIQPNLLQSQQNQSQQNQSQQNPDYLAQHSLLNNSQPQYFGLNSGQDSNKNNLLDHSSYIAQNLNQLTESHSHFPQTQESNSSYISQSYNQLSEDHSHYPQISNYSSSGMDDQNFTENPYLQSLMNGSTISSNRKGNHDHQMVGSLMDTASIIRSLRHENSSFNGSENMSNSVYSSHPPLNQNQLSQFGQQNFARSNLDLPVDSESFHPNDIGQLLTESHMPELVRSSSSRTISLRSSPNSNSSLKLNVNQ